MTPDARLSLVAPPCIYVSHDLGALVKGLTVNDVVFGSIVY